MSLPWEAPWLWLAAAAIAALGVQSLRLWWVRARPRRRLRAAAVRGAAGEERAASLLERHGYAIEQRQSSQAWSVLVDGEELPVTVRADYLVTRRGRRYVAEVKTGEAAPRADHPPTRRQLLEYRHAFDVDGILLVQAEAGRIQEVAFPAAFAARPPARSPWTWLVLGFLVGAACGAVAVDAARARPSSAPARGRAKAK